MEKQSIALKEQNFADNIKDNCTKKIENLDHFAKRAMQAHVDLNTELLYGSLNVAQHYIELQEKIWRDTPTLYPVDFMANMFEQNTETWVKGLENIDTVYIEYLKNFKNNIRSINKNSNLIIQSIDRFYDKKLF